MPSSRFEFFIDRTESRQNNFDALRLLLALLVIFSHSYPLLGKDNQELFGRLTRQTDGGQIAVDWFFVISGFLITASWQHSRSVWDYAARRCRRIYPGFVIALCVCAFVVGPIGADDAANYFHQHDIFAFIYRPLLFRQVISVQNVFSHQAQPGNLNGSLWTIRFELFCYVIVAIVGCCNLFRRRILLMGAFLASLAVYRFWHGRLIIPYFDYLDDLPRFVTFFLAGAVFYLYRDRIPYSRWIAAVSVLGILMSCWHGFSFLFPLFGTYLLFYLAFNHSIRCYGAAKYGDFSYGTYLYAFPIQQMIVMKFGSVLGPLTLFLVAAPATLAVAVLSWHLVENPFLRRTRTKVRLETGQPSSVVVPVLEAARV